MRQLILALALGALFYPPAFADDLVGTWIIRPDPGQLDSTLVLRRRDNVIEGVWLRAFGDADIPIRNIREDDESLTINLELKPGASATFPHFLKGARKGDEMRLDVLDGDGRFLNLVINAYKASRLQVAERDAAIPRTIHVTKVPLPALRDVPPNGLAQTPPMCWNSWNHFGDAIDDRTVRQIADALADSGLRDAGYVYVNLDVGWQGRRDEHGEIHSNVKFPDMKDLGSYLHERGLKFGIYSTPGPRDCLNRIGSHGYEEQDAATFARWSVDYLKYDACTAKSVYHTEAEGQALYQKMGVALRATGRPIVYSLSGFGDERGLGRKVGANLWRTSGDIADRWSIVSKIGFEQSGDPAAAGPGAWNDPDMLEVGNGAMTLEEYRTQLSLWSILAAPLILGNDVRHMSAEIRELLLNAEVIAIDQDTLGQQGHRVVQRELVEVWVKPLASGALAVGLFNRSDGTKSIGIRWPELGLNGPQAVRDLWRRSDVGTLADRYDSDVPPHGSVLLRVTPAR